MSPVDRAGPISEISPYLETLCKNFDGFIWKGGLAQFPRSRVSNRDLVKRKMFPHEHFRPVTGNEGRMNSSQQRMRHMVDSVARTRSQDLRPFLISETGVKFFMWTQVEIGPSNRAHVKRPWVFLS